LLTLSQQGVLDNAQGRTPPYGTIALVGLCIATYYFRPEVDMWTSQVLGMGEITSVKRNCIDPHAIWYAQKPRKS